MIQRKPVPKSSPIEREHKLALECINEVVLLKPHPEIDQTAYHSDTDDSLLDCYLQSDTDEPPEQSETNKPPEYIDIEVISISSKTSASVTDPSDSRSTKFKHALEAALSEAKHFAGGLISHPHESTRHYTILRHSLGLIYYRGPMTSVEVTIFSDHALPEDRTIWLQRRGFSGKTGLAIGAALGAKSAWIDVTPVAQTTPDQLPKDQERAWQRDMLSFSKKNRDVKYVRDHTPCETNVVRIPHTVEDGYFRLLVCSGRKVLCPSPTFRYASTSMDPGSLRGASLLTLPLEVGLKVGARMATTAVNAASHHTLRPATAVVQTASKHADWAPVHLIGVRGASAWSETDGGYSVKR